MYRILSLDGGGVRGLLTTRLLEKIALTKPHFWEKLDLIAGTSTGSIPALGLAAGMTPAKLSRVYQKSCEIVFRDSAIDDLKDGFLLWGAQYGNEGMKQALTDLFGDRRLGDLQKKVLVPTIDLDNKPDDPRDIRHWKAKFFHNYDLNHADANERVVDIALRSMAAPVFFPIYQGYIDGGIVANNPSLCAVVQVLSSLPVQVPLSQMVLLSLGTGRNPKYIPEEDGDWGLSQWSFRPRTADQPPLRLPLVELMFETSVGLADFQCRQLLGERYHRLDPILKLPIDLDDNNQLPRLNQLAGRENVMTTVEWLMRYY